MSSSLSYFYLVWERGRGRVVTISPDYNLYFITAVGKMKSSRINSQSLFVSAARLTGDRIVSSDWSVATVACPGLPK